MTFTNKLAKPLSALALALAFSNAAQAAIIEYKYSNSDAKNTITAHFFIDESKATKNLISGTFTVNGTSYTASSTKSTGFTDVSKRLATNGTYTGYTYNLSTKYDQVLAILNYDFVNKSGNSTTTVYSLFFDYDTGYNIKINGAGTLTKVVAATTPVPEAETYAMMLVGLGLMGFTVRRKKQAV